MGTGDLAGKAIATAYGLKPNTTFWIVEVEAPAGYELAEAVKVVIDENGRVVFLEKDQSTGEYPATPSADSEDWIPMPADALFEYQITDSALYALPKAGGLGILEFLFIGAFIMTLIAGIWRYTRRESAGPRTALRAAPKRR